MAARAASVTDAVAVAKAVAMDRLQQSRVDIVLEALTTDAEIDPAWCESMTGFTEGCAPCASWGLEFQDVGISSDDCKARGEPIYVFPPDLWNQPDLSAGTDKLEPAFVSPSDYLIPVTQPPPGLEPMVPWCSDGMGVGFEFNGIAATEKMTKPQQRRRRRCQLLLATHLREMEGEDASCIIHFRQIHKLGFQSPDILREYCSSFGPVKRVAVSNAHEKIEEAPRVPYQVRVRPSGIGLVVMERPQDAEAVVAEGESQTICGFQVRVRKFQAREDKGQVCEDHVYKSHDDLEDASVATTRSPSLVDSLADGTLSELSVEADQAEEEPH